MFWKLAGAAVTWTCGKGFPSRNFRAGRGLRPCQIPLCGRCLSPLHGVSPPGGQPWAPLPPPGPSDSEPTTAFPCVQLRLCGDLGRGPWRLAALEPVPAPALCQPGVLLCHRHSLQTALPQTEARCKQWHRQGPAPRLTRSRGWRRLTGGEAFCPGGWPPGRNTKFTLRRGIWVCRPPFPSLVLCFKSEMPSSPGGIPGCSKQTKALALMER